MPRCLGTSQSVRASSRPRSAWWALVLHSFWPLTTHSSPSRSARVVSPARSEPLPGSLNSWHHVSSPVIARGSRRRFSSSEPWASSVGAASPMPPPTAGPTAPAAASSSATIGVGPAGQAAAVPLGRPRRRRPAGSRRAGGATRAAPASGSQCSASHARTSARTSSGVVIGPQPVEERAQHGVERVRVGDRRGVAGAVDDGERRRRGSWRPCTASRRGTASSCSPTTTSVGTVIAGSASMTWPSAGVSTPRAASASPSALRWTPAVSSSLPGSPSRPSLVEVAGVALGHLVPLVAAAVAAVAGAGVDEHEGRDALGVGEGQLERQVAAERVADEHGPLGADVVEDRRAWRRATWRPSRRRDRPASRCGRGRACPRRSTVWSVDEVGDRGRRTCATTPRTRG